jgi:hypothetical protein
MRSALEDSSVLEGKNSLDKPLVDGHLSEGVTLSTADTPSIPLQLAPFHPYTSCLSGKVQLTEHVIDMLFKSRE